MKNIRIGKDIKIQWHILTNGEEISLDGRSLTLFIKSAIGTVKHDFNVEGNVVVFIFRAFEQKTIGTYNLTLYENYGKEPQTVVDCCNAFELVSSTCEEERLNSEDCGCDNNLEFETINLETSVLEMGVPGPGVPAGGVPGQLLTKYGDRDYESEWADLKIPENVITTEKVAEIIDPCIAATSAANNAATRAINAAIGVEEATIAANAAAGSANEATANVTQAIDTATTAADNANAAADRAEELTNLFSDLSDGKRKIAAAITTQGVPTDDSESLASMSDNIRQLYLPQDTDFWKAFGYDTPEDYSGGLTIMLEAMQALKVNWDNFSFVNNVSGWVATYPLGKNKLVIMPKVDTSNVTNMSNMFYNCTSLQSVPLLDTSNVTHMSYMFQSCTSLQSVPLLDTSKVTNMSNMFYNCTSLQSVPLLDTSNVTNMSSMFQSCTSLQSVPLLDTSKVTNMSNMFYNCTSLQSVPLLDTSNVTNMSSMFYGCSSLRECKLRYIKTSVDLHWSPNLENESILFIIANSAPTINITITLHANAYDRAMADEAILSALEEHPLVTLAKA